MVDAPPEKNSNAPSGLQEADEELKEPAAKRKYIQVDYDKRKQLLQIIDEENMTIKSAAEKLSINYSNAKNIVKLFKKEHRIEKLPKKPSLTLKEITTPSMNNGAIPFQAALLPFYDPAEAEQFMNRHKQKHEESARNSSPGISRVPTYGQFSKNSRVDSESNTMVGFEVDFNFEVYSPMILGR